MEKRPTTLTPKFEITDEMVMEDEELQDAYWDERINASRVYGPQWALANFSTDGRVFGYIIDGEMAGFASENSDGKSSVKGRLNTQGNRSRVTPKLLGNFETAKKILAEHYGVSD